MARLDLPKFVAIDGEGVNRTLADGTIFQDYVMLGSSLGDVIESRPGSSLKPQACLNFLLAQSGTLVSFAFNYDVSMILRSLPREDLVELWGKGETRTIIGNDAYYLRWIPGKMFEVGRYLDRKKVTVYDSWGFFQASFIKALEMHNMSSELIEQMKAQRNTFDDSNRKTMREYMLEECGLLTAMMDDLALGLSHAGIRPRGWYGPGAVATDVLNAEGVGEYHRHDSDLAKGKEPAMRAIFGAYFGGRVELGIQGTIDKLWTYDIRSAYPWAAQYLPSLKGAKLIRIRNLAGSPIEPYAIYRVRYSAAHPRIAPFPHRLKKEIYWPSSGEGWYHSVEIQAAIDVGCDIEFVDGYRLYTPDKTIKPFGWVPYYYEKRLEAKRKGENDKPYKLVLNSLYGKLAQGYTGGKRLPKFQSYYWAGLITATCRAAMLRAAMASPDSWAWTSTDGIAFTEQVESIHLGPELGDWEEKIIEDAIAIRAGIYSCTIDGEPYARSRGWFVRELDFDAIRAEWLEHGPLGTYSYPTHRFVGIGSALHLNIEPGQWVDSERTMSFSIERKIVPMETGERLYLMPPLAMGMSEPYTPKAFALDGMQDDLDWLQGTEQPSYG